MNLFFKTVIYNITIEIKNIEQFKEFPIFIKQQKKTKNFFFKILNKIYIKKKKQKKKKKFSYINKMKNFFLKNTYKHKNKTFIFFNQNKNKNTYLYKTSKKNNYLTQSILQKVSPLKNKITLLNFNYSKIKKTKKFWNKSKLFLKTYKLLKKTRVAFLFYQAIFIMMRFKDIKPLNFCIKNILEKNHYTEHKKYFYMLKSFLTIFCKKIKKKYNVLGLKLKLAGKLGVGGNAKKRKKYYSFGKKSNTSKYLKRDDIYEQVRTKTGTVGYVLSIFY